MPHPRIEFKTNAEQSSTTYVLVEMTAAPRADVRIGMECSYQTGYMGARNARTKIMSITE
jgi:hypothetical protein